MPNELKESAPTQKQIFSQNSHLGSENKIYAKRLRAKTIKSRNWSQISGLIHSNTAPPLGNNWYSYVNGDPINNSDPSGYVGPLGLAVGFLVGYSAYKASKKYDAAHARDRCDRATGKIKENDRDKYQHCMAVCSVNRNAGILGGLGGLALGYGREYVDWKEGDAQRDIAANHHGFWSAYNLNRTCHQSCTRYWKNL
jgi:hypothetical protein